MSERLLVAASLLRATTSGIKGFESCGETLVPKQKRCALHRLFGRLVGQGSLQT